jgi:hypothetical protein
MPVGQKSWGFTLTISLWPKSNTDSKLYAIGGARFGFFQVTAVGDVLVCIENLTGSAFADLLSATATIPSSAALHLTYSTAGPMRARSVAYQSHSSAVGQ